MLVKGFYINKNKIIYQFYEKFGFTDVCIHSRSYFSVDSLHIDTSWHPLPLSSSDLDKINHIENKIDTLSGDFIPLRYRYKMAFDDISLEKEEYISKSMTDSSIGLQRGFYKLNGNSITIYDPSSHCAYYEEHACDGH